jgi:hypothetical protein
MRSAGVSDACIQQLDNATLAQMKSITNKRTRTSMGVIDRRQRIRFTASKVCPEL